MVAKVSLFAGLLLWTSSSAAEIMSWVPAYAIPQSAKALNKIPARVQAPTQIGLQFWNPTHDGQVVLAPIDSNGKALDTNSIISFRHWSKSHNAKLLLTIYNNSEVMRKWDWELAKSAFADHKDAFIKSLIGEVKHWDLDGVDIDLEGKGSLDTDRANFATFLHQLAAELRKNGKSLSVNSFHSPCVNAPNMSWWEDWRGIVDQIQSMGYQDLYEGSTEVFVYDNKVCQDSAHIFRYSYQKKWAQQVGYNGRLLMGIPGDMDAWGTAGRGSNLPNHLDEIQDLGMGIAIWDMQLKASYWRELGTWAKIQEIQGQRPRQP